MWGTWMWGTWMWKPRLWTLVMKEKGSVSEEIDSFLIHTRKFLWNPCELKLVHELGHFSFLCLLKFSCRLSSGWIIYEKPLFKILFINIIRIFLTCFTLTFLFSSFQSIKSTVNWIFSTSFFISLQYI